MKNSFRLYALVLGSVFFCVNAKADISPEEKKRCAMIGYLAQQIAIKRDQGLSFNDAILSAKKAGRPDLVDFSTNITKLVYFQLKSSTPMDVGISFTQVCMRNP